MDLPHFHRRCGSSRKGVAIVATPNNALQGGRPRRRFALPGYPRPLRELGAPERER